MPLNYGGFGELNRFFGFTSLIAFEGEREITVVLVCLAFLADFILI